MPNSAGNSASYDCSWQRNIWVVLRSFPTRATQNANDAQLRWATFRLRWPFPSGISKFILSKWRSGGIATVHFLGPRDAPDAGCLGMFFQEGGAPCLFILECLTRPIMEMTLCSSPAKHVNAGPGTVWSSWSPWSPCWVSSDNFFLLLFRRTNSFRCHRGCPR